jgi:predicted small lipoprotein YifL
MKKLLALAALSALTLTGCGGTGKSEAPPALVQPTETKPSVPSTEARELTQVGDGYLWEVTGTNSNGMRFRCYVTDGPSSVAQTCFEYGPVSH